MNTPPLKAARRARRRGFTLAEMSIASAVSMLVMASVLALQYLSVRLIKETYGPTNARTSRMNALNQLRLRLADGQIGSVELKAFDEGGNAHRIEYFDPFLDETCAFQFVVQEGQNKGELRFFDDVDDSPGSYRTVSRGPIDISFSKGFWDPTMAAFVEQDTMVTLRVRTASHLAYADVDERDGETIVYLRNPEN